MNKTLIAVVGPTAIGKTALGIELASYYNTEILSADSRQFFKEMTIGTAVPSLKELEAAKHHFLQHISIDKGYNIGLFEEDALNKLDQIFTSKNKAILVGGSGLYVDAVIDGIDDFPDITIEIRENLQERLIKNGIESLQQELKLLDPVHFDKMDINNPQRLIRALEICIGTGKPYSSFTALKRVKRPFQTLKIGLKAEREIIYDRINKRVDLMIDAGLIDEAKALYPYRHLNALQTVGYRELFTYFDGDSTLDTAIEEIKKNTRRFAKRQLTWYRKDASILWFEYTTPIEDIIEIIEKKVSL